MVTKTIGQNPQANQIMSALQAHMAEHLGFQYRSQIEKQMGVALPAPDSQLPEAIEVELSRLVATASQQLLQIHKGEAQTQQAQEQMKDPLIQMQQQELQIKQAEQQRKALKDQVDSQAKIAQIETERLRIETQAQTDAMRIQAQGEADALRALNESERERLRLGIEVAKENARLKGKK
jgi:hypothetical protein